MPLPLDRAAPAVAQPPPLQAFGLPPREGMAMPGRRHHRLRAAAAPMWLRGHADDAEFRRRAEAVLGVALPLLPRGLCLFGGGSGAGVALRMSADEWLLVCRPVQREPLLRALRDALLDVFAQVVDTSAGMAAVRLAGPRCLALLQRLGCRDFSGLAAGSGTGTGTVMSRASVIVISTDVDGVLLVFPRSLARHVWRLIERQRRAPRPAHRRATPAPTCFAPLIAAA